jgi:hypothetical protein
MKTGEKLARNLSSKSEAKAMKLSSFKLSDMAVGTRLFVIKSSRWGVIVSVLDGPEKNCTIIYDDLKSISRYRSPTRMDLGLTFNDLVGLKAMTQAQRWTSSEARDRLADYEVNRKLAFDAIQERIKIREDLHRNAQYSYLNRSLPDLVDRGILNIGLQLSAYFYGVKFNITRQDDFDVRIEYSGNYPPFNEVQDYLGCYVYSGVPTAHHENDMDAWHTIFGVVRGLFVVNADQKCGKPMAIPKLYHPMARAS